MQGWRASYRVDELVCIAAVFGYLYGAHEPNS